ncbi:PadR family transcriptional regulator [Paenibacillus sp. AR247]|uniref:PadR family transcriptional regulator n=1 Tax=Paenibacillus sp. AR247 TaxID=1631599 RepID=UPI000CFA5773|nr:PadR family transcriptional regulator [Paenibacillus sp. AR247]PQP86299.1 hypothetical protein CPT76_32035 [Paenibacillus sp. AR247]
MNSIHAVLLSLLAREPLSGYDIKQQIKGRTDFFFKINNNQLYPALAKLEAEGVIRLQALERETYRPAKKIYEITDAGLERLKNWVLEPGEPGDWNEFLLKQYSSWLVKPEELIPVLTLKKREHEEQLDMYRNKVESLREQSGLLTSDHPIFSSVAVIEMGMAFEQANIEWCGKMIGWLKENRL